MDFNEAFQMAVEVRTKLFCELFMFHYSKTQDTEEASNLASDNSKEATKILSEKLLEDLLAPETREALAKTLENIKDQPFMDVVEGLLKELK